jgi:hypothetical protein
MATHKFYAIVSEREDPVHFTTLNDREVDEHGEYGLEVLAQEYCTKYKLTFVAVAL